MRILLTVACALWLLFALAFSLAAANALPGAWGLLMIPVMAANGFFISDVIGDIWTLDGQYDDGECV